MKFISLKCAIKRAVYSKTILRNNFLQFSSLYFYALFPSIKCLIITKWIKKIAPSQQLYRVLSLDMFLTVVQNFNSIFFFITGGHGLENTNSENYTQVLHLSVNPTESHLLHK